MLVATGTVLLERYRVRAPPLRDAGALVFPATLVDEQAGEPRLAWLVVLPHARPTQQDVRLVLDRAARFAVGVSSIVQPSAFGNVVSRDGIDHWALAFESPEASDLQSVLSASSERVKVARLVSAVADAVAALHDQGVAHGHLRPDLLWVRPDGDVLVGGIGAAALAEAVGGTALCRDALPQSYRAPEQLSALAARAQPWTDIYALGVLACELIAGRELPAPVDASALSHALSDRAQRLLASALSDTPAMRPTDTRRWAQELAEALLEPSSVAPAPLLPATESAFRSAPQPVEASPPHELASPTAVAAPEASGAPPPAAASTIPKRSRWPLLAAAVVVGSLLTTLAVAAVFVHALINASPAGPKIPSVPHVSGGAGGAPAVGGLGGGANTDAGTAEEEPEPSEGGSAAEELDDIEDVEQDEVPLPALAALPAVTGSAYPNEARAALPVTADAPIWGPREAWVTIVIFGDLECPHTKRLYRALRHAKNEFGPTLRLVWRHRPVSTHPTALGAARMVAGAHTARGTAFAWKLIDQILASSAPLGQDQLEQWVSRAGEDSRAWLESPAVAAALDRDLELTGRFRIRHTPTLYVNGLELVGERSASQLSPIIAKELQSSLTVVASGVPKDALYAARVEKNLIGIGKDPPERACPENGTSPSRGALSPLVTLVEFCDFESKFCKQVQPTLETLLARHRNEVRLVFKHLPLEEHPLARPAANFAIEAGALAAVEGFWRAERALFEAQPRIDDPGLLEIARSLRLDESALMRAAKTDKHASRIVADLRLADELEVNGVPTFFINGRRMAGAQPLAKFSAIVAEEIDAARRLMAAGIARDAVAVALCGRERKASAELKKR
jgi:protein-disulfide isomerase